MSTHNAPFDGSTTALPQELVFAARLTPYRSLSPYGFRVLMSFIGGFCFIAGTVFFVLGLWPVVGFLGLDVALVYWAFRSNYSAAKAYEDVEISRHHVWLRKVSPKGRKVDHDFPQFGTRLEVDRHEEIGITAMRIANRQATVSLGSFLNPADRESFASAFRQALARAKR